MVVQPVIMQLLAESGADMAQGDDYEARALDALKRAVAEALERKRRLGQFKDE